MFFFRRTVIELAQENARIAERLELLKHQLELEKQARLIFLSSFIYFF